MDNTENFEIKLAYLEDYMKQLNEVVLEQFKQIGKLESEQKLLKNQLEELTDQLPGPESTKPPHY
ncbi:MAG: SlyX family protein [Spirochaetales bacterium]|nr:SlyX family protein [Spirochaetales bacterium]